MLAVPAASAVMTPVGLTVATAGVELDHVTVLPVSAFPAASVSWALACPVCPATSDDALNETTTAATGAGETAKLIVAVLPSLDAVMTTLPAVIAFTSPVADTVAIAVLAEVQPTVRPVSTLPAASSA
jgi:hypothetical protein